jgi:hypothetical protein
MRALNFVKFATATTGTSDIAIGSADTGFITPAQAGVANGDRVPYVIDDGTDWAFGIGAYSTSGPTLQRDANEVRVAAGTKLATKLSLSGSAKVYFDLGEGTVLPRPEVLSQASASTLTPDINNYGVFRFTALAANLTINAPTGTPYDGQPIRFEFRDDGTERTLTWNAAWHVGPSTKPATTGNDATFAQIVEFTYDAARAKWLCMAVDAEPVVRYATIDFVGGSTATAAGTAGNHTVSLAGTLSGGLSSSPQEGDIVVVAINLPTTSTDLGLFINEAGWTNLADLHSLDSTTTNFGVFYKVMGPTPDASFSFPGFSDVIAMATAVHVYRNVDPNSPIDVATTTATGNDLGQPNPPSITPTNNAKLVVAGAASLATSIPSLTQPGSELSNFISANSSDNRAAAIGLGWANGSAGVAFDPVAWTGGSASTSASWAAATVALRPKIFN